MMPAALPAFFIAFRTVSPASIRSVADISLTSEKGTSTARVMYLHLENISSV